MRSILALTLAGCAAATPGMSSLSDCARRTSTRYGRVTVTSYYLDGQQIAGHEWRDALSADERLRALVEQSEDEESKSTVAFGFTLGIVPLSVILPVVTLVVGARASVTAVAAIVPSAAAITLFGFSVKWGVDAADDLRLAESEYNNDAAYGNCPVVTAP